MRVGVSSRVFVSADVWALIGNADFERDGAGLIAIADRLPESALAISGCRRDEQHVSRSLSRWLSDSRTTVIQVGRTRVGQSATGESAKRRAECDASPHQAHETGLAAARVCDGDSPIAWRYDTANRPRCVKPKRNPASVTVPACELSDSHR
jgi:hypothetical protein